MSQEIFENELEEQKDILARDSDVYKIAMEKQLQEITDDAAKLGKTLLLAGAGALVTYVLVKKIFGKKKNKKTLAELPESETKSPSFISTLVKQQATLFLLGMAKDKLSNYADYKANQNEPLQ